MSPQSSRFVSSKAPGEKYLAGFDAERCAGRTHYDPAAAAHALEFFPRMLRHVKGPLTGQPLELSDWERAATATLFGWRRRDGSRRFRHMYCELPRKNGKSTWLAGTVCYAFFCDPQSAQGAELYSAAATAEQAGLVFGQVASMIQANPLLLKRAKISRSVRRINRMHNGILQNTFYRAIPAETAQAHGFNATVIAADELHAWHGRDFYDALQTSTGARTQPLSIDITTAGWDRESICWMQHDYAQKVLDGAVDDDAFLPLLYTVPETADWTSPHTWRKANPNLGISVSLDYLARECAKAQESKAYENTFRRLHLNQWTQQATRFLQMAQWHRAARVYDDEDLVGQECYGGLDLSATTDITAWVLVFPQAGGGYRILPRLFIPEGAASRITRTDSVPYLAWAAKGHVTCTPGDAVDYEFVRGQILDDARRFKLRQVGYDPWNAYEMWQQLAKDGLQCIEIRQGARSLSAPLKELERALIAGEFEHPNNPCLNWQAQSLEVSTDPNGNIRPVRPKHGAHRLKIDGLVALVMGLALCMLRPEEVRFDASCFLSLELKSDERHTP